MLRAPIRTSRTRFHGAFRSSSCSLNVTFVVPSVERDVLDELLDAAHRVLVIRVRLVPSIVNSGFRL